MNHPSLHRFAASAFLLFAVSTSARGETPLRQGLKAVPFKIAWECYVDGNWEIFVMNADGSQPVNLTHTPKVHEHYPQVSPDGTKMCFTVDSGEGRDGGPQPVGHGYRRQATAARSPTTPGSRSGRPTARRSATCRRNFRGSTSSTSPPRAWSSITWTAARASRIRTARSCTIFTIRVRAQRKMDRRDRAWRHMGFGHAILLIEAHGKRIINLKIPGCRPCLSPDGRHIAWGAGDHELAMAPIDLDAETPAVGPGPCASERRRDKIYHIDWSPDSRFVAFSRGPESEGDLSKAGTFQAACEIVGVYAKGWNICVGRRPTGRARWT